MPQRARLKVYGQGEIEVELVAAYLNDFKHAYDSILVFESVIEGLRWVSRESPFPLYPFGLGFGWPLAPRRAVRYVRDWPPTLEEVASLVPRSEQLILAGVHLSSPGFWEFLGSINPFEVLRKYLNDRHERRKDREYRESAERRRLDLDNLQQGIRVLAEAKELGIPDRDLAPLYNELVYKPLSKLDRYQDKGVIEGAEILRLPDQR